MFLKLVNSSKYAEVKVNTSIPSAPSKSYSLPQINKQTAPLGSSSAKAEMLHLKQKWWLSKKPNDRPRIPGYDKTFSLEDAGHLERGLWTDDTHHYEDPVILEAVRRAPEYFQIERTNRMKVAFDLDIKKTVLPEDMWTKAEEDLYYLYPYIEEILQETRERDLFRL